MSIFKNLIDSFHNQPAGFSARKLSAFAGVCISVWITFKNSTPDNVQELVWAWNIFVWFCLGLITASQLLEFRTGTKTTMTETKTEIKEETTKPE